jgi:hypothetical protein
MIPDFKGHHFAEDNKPNEDTIAASLRKMRHEGCS